MGTSVNQRSSASPSWAAARAVLGNVQAPIERQSEEIWRAAAADTDANLIPRLGGAEFAYAAQLAETSSGPLGAREAYDTYLAKAGVLSVVAEFARRALVRAVADHAGSLGYARELFAEAASYYIARDLPSIVGKSVRVATPSEAALLKQQIADIARSRAATVANSLPQGQWAKSTLGWKRYVAAVVASLREKPR